MFHPRVVSFVVSLVGLAASAATAQVAAPSPQKNARGGSPTGDLETSLLRALQANPATALYGFATERRGSKIALRGRVGTKQVHDSAIQTAIALGVPVIDDLVIDTLAVHQAAAYQARVGVGMGYGSAGMGYGPSGMGYGSAGMGSLYGSFPGASTLYTNLPYTYPQPLFGKLDEPFFGFEPPAISYPPWWGAMTAARLGPPQAAQGPVAGTNPASSPASDSTDASTLDLPYGTIDMAIDPRGVATLRGAVPSLAERITLGQRVAQTPGVTQVINLLNVKPGLVVDRPLGDKPPPPPVPADLPGGPAPASAPIARPADRVAAAEPGDGVGPRASRAVASRPGLEGLPVKVKVRDGVASLSGKVPTVYEAMLAYRAVQKTPGVREVDDRLEFVVPDGTGSNPLVDRGRPEDVEPYLEAQIRRQVGDLAHLDRVRAQGDSLELRGTLEREDDRPRFDAILRSMPILRGFRIAADFPAESR